MYIGIRDRKLEDDKKDMISIIGIKEMMIKE